MSQHDKFKYALFLPQGSVRALLAILVLAILFYTIAYNVPDQYFTAMAALAGSVVTSYFSQRKREDDQETNGGGDA